MRCPRAGRCRSTSRCKDPGDSSGEATPVPIPNTEVKLSSAEDTERAAFRENRSSPGSFAFPRAIAEAAAIGAATRAYPRSDRAADVRPPSRSTTRAGGDRRRRAAPAVDRRRRRRGARSARPRRRRWLVATASPSASTVAGPSSRPPCRPRSSASCASIAAHDGCADATSRPEWRRRLRRSHSGRARPPWTAVRGTARRSRRRPPLGAPASQRAAARGSAAGAGPRSGSPLRRLMVVAFAVILGGGRLPRRDGRIAVEGRRLAPRARAVRAHGRRRRRAGRPRDRPRRPRRATSRRRRRRRRLGRHRHLGTPRPADRRRAGRRDRCKPATR